MEPCGAQVAHACPSLVAAAFKYDLDSFFPIAHPLNSVGNIELEALMRLPRWPDSIAQVTG